MPNDGGLPKSTTFFKDFNWKTYYHLVWFQQENKFWFVCKIWPAFTSKFTSPLTMFKKFNLQSLDCLEIIGYRGLTSVNDTLYNVCHVFQFKIWAWQLRLYDANLVITWSRNPHAKTSIPGKLNKSCLIGVWHKGNLYLGTNTIGNRKPPPNEYWFANEKYKDDATKLVVLR